jgi:GTP cyclohydrolase II
LGTDREKLSNGIGAQILRELGVLSMRLLNNNSRELITIEGYGWSLTEW